MDAQEIVNMFDDGLITRDEALRMAHRHGVFHETAVLLNGRSDEDVLGEDF